MFYIRGQSLQVRFLRVAVVGSFSMMTREPIVGIGETLLLFRYLQAVPPLPCLGQSMLGIGFLGCGK